MSRFYWRSGIWSGFMNFKVYIILQIVLMQFDSPGGSTSLAEGLSNASSSSY